MILPDINLLIYAYDTLSPKHQKAKLWWEACVTGTEPVGLSWVVALGFIRLWTNPRIFANPMTTDQAATHVESWLKRKVIRVIQPTPVQGELLFRFLRETGSGCNLTTDTHLAALAIEHKAVIHTADTDFLRIEDVRWVNPLGSPVVDRR